MWIHTEFLVFKDKWTWVNADDYILLTECDKCPTEMKSAGGCIGCVNVPESR